MQELKIKLLIASIIFGGAAYLSAKWGEVKWTAYFLYCAVRLSTCGILIGYIQNHVQEV